MKKIKYLLIICLASIFGKVSTAQLYLNTSGGLSVGSTSSTTYGFQSFGTSLFSSGTGSNSAALINAKNGYSTASNLDYTWSNDTWTGIYHPSLYNIGFSTDGGQIMNMSSSNGNEVDTYNTGAYGVTNISHLAGTNARTFMVNYNSAYTFYVYGSGQAWSYGWNSLSDSTLKENIHTIPNALNKVLKLRGVNYNFIPQKLKDPKDTLTKLPQGPAKMQMGVIAQEVEKIVPEVVNTNAEGLKGVQYQNLVGLLIEAIKEQNKRIDSLQATIENCCQNNQGTGMLNSNQSPNNTAAAVYQNNPNPFSQETSISYFLPSSTQRASLMILDMEGKLIKSLQVTSFGQGAVKINGGELTSGIYYYTLIADGKEVGTKKMILTQ